MYLQFHSVKEPSKNHDIWVVRFFYGVRSGSVLVLAHFYVLPATANDLYGTSGS